MTKQPNTKQSERKLIPNNQPFGLISAEIKTNTIAENRDNSRLLLAYLLKSKFNAVQIDGTQSTSSRSSQNNFTSRFYFFTDPDDTNPKRLIKTLGRIARKFNQASFVYKAEKTPAIIFETSNDDFVQSDHSIQTEYTPLDEAELGALLSVLTQQRFKMTSLKKMSPPDTIFGKVALNGVLSQWKDWDQNP